MVKLPRRNVTEEYYRTCVNVNALEQINDDVE